MTHLFENSRKWNTLSTDEKLDALHESIEKLFSIVEELSHKDHVFIDAINLVHSRIDAEEKAIHAIERHAHSAELMAQ